MKYIKQTVSTVEVVSYVVRGENGEEYAVPAESFERDYSPQQPGMVLPHPQIRPAQNITIPPQVKTQTLVPPPNQPQARADDRPDDYSTVVCSECGEPYKRGTGSPSGYFCPACTKVKCPVCKVEVISLSEAREFNACLVCRMKQR